MEFFQINTTYVIQTCSSMPMTKIWANSFVD